MTSGNSEMVVFFGLYNQTQLNYEIKTKSVGKRGSMRFIMHNCGDVKAMHQKIDSCQSSRLRTMKTQKSHFLSQFLMFLKSDFSI